MPSPLSFLRRLRLPARLRHSKGEVADRVARLFDAAHYLEHYPDVAKAGVDPLRHYLTQGWREGRDPSASFSTSDYLRRYPELQASGVCPLVHFASSESSVPARPSADTLSSSRPPGRLDVQLQTARAELGAVASPSLAGVMQAIDALNQAVPRLAVGGEPEVSIVIAVHGQVGYTLACLRSLLSHRSGHAAEIILYDDASPEGSMVDQLSRLRHVRYVRAPVNHGYLDACNEASSLARGKFLVLLNSDTQVLDGWLDELIGSFKLFPQAGLVGSKLIYPNGLVQEAGGLVWSDGEAGNYGHGEAADDPKLSFARRVDYCSAASIAMPLALWRQLGGFDRLFSPAYAEDTDLAFRVREAGHEVWYQPLSTVIHHEGQSHGTDISTGVKQYQVENLQRFYGRWAATLATHGNDRNATDAEADRTHQRRILIVDSVTPTPDRDSGSLITDRLIAAYQELGYRVTFVPQVDCRHAGAYTEALQRRGVECVYLPFVASFDDFLARNSLYFDAVLVFRYHNLDEVMDRVRMHMPDTPIILHTVDLHFVRQAREAELLGSSERRMKALRVKYTELEMAARADAVVVHTPVERDTIVAEIGQAPLIVFPYVADPRPSAVPFERRLHILFLGGFGHSPNGDAVAYFLDEIWPGLVRLLPEAAEFYVIGGDVPQELRVRASDRVKFVGQVGDLAPWFEQGRVFVAPLRYGAGIKGKLIQAMAHGVPSVVTSIAAEGMGLRDGQHTMVAETPEAFIEAVAAIYADSERWEALRDAGLDFVAANYSWQRCLSVCEEMVALAQQTFAARLETQLRTRLETFVPPRLDG